MEIHLTSKKDELVACRKAEILQRFVNWMQFYFCFFRKTFSYFFAQIKLLENLHFTCLSIKGKGAHKYRCIKSNVKSLDKAATVVKMFCTVL